MNANDNNSLKNQTLSGLYGVISDRSMHTICQRLAIDECNTSDRSGIIHAKNPLSSWHKRQPKTEPFVIQRLYPAAGLNQIAQGHRSDSCQGRNGFKCTAYLPGCGRGKWLRGFLRTGQALCTQATRQPSARRADDQFPKRYVGVVKFHVGVGGLLQGDLSPEAPLGVRPYPKAMVTLQKKYWEHARIGPKTLSGSGNPSKFVQDQSHDRGKK